MRYYSTNGAASEVTLKEAIIKGLAPDKGLYMPESIKTLPAAFFKNIGGLSLQEIAYAVADSLFGEDVDADVLKRIVYDALNFDIPLHKVADRRYCLELYHGPTLAFKDVGARFMARMLGYFNAQDSDKRPVNVLVATSGDTGSAVANGFLGVDGVHVYVLYPKGKVSHIQESQFTTLGRNITAVEVDGTFDDCQALVKKAFMDEQLNAHMKLTSANSINIARFLPQMFYYFYAYAQLAAAGKEDLSQIVVAVPSGNFGNLTAGLIAKRMGLPIKRFIAANNSNDAQIGETLASTFKTENYLLDPHGAVGYRAISECLADDEVGICLETAHPAKFKETVDSLTGGDVAIPERLKAFMDGEKKSVQMLPSFREFKDFLMRE